MHHECRDDVISLHHECHEGRDDVIPKILDNMMV